MRPSVLRPQLKRDPLGRTSRETRDFADQPIAELSLRARSAERGEFPLRVQIWQPVPSDRAPWACAMAVDGLMSRPTHAYGEDSMQALCLAIWFVAQELFAFVEKGGQLWNAEDDPKKQFPLEAYFLAFRPPPGKGAA